MQHPFLQRGKRHWDLLQLTSSPSGNCNPSAQTQKHKPHQFSLSILPRGAQWVLPEFHLSSVSQLLFKFYKLKAEKSKSAPQFCACGRRWRNPRGVEDLCLGRTMWIPELLTCCKLSNGGQRSTPSRLGEEKQLKGCEVARCLKLLWKRNPCSSQRRKKKQERRKERSWGRSCFP